MNDYISQTYNKAYDVVSKAAAASGGMDDFDRQPVLVVSGGQYTAPRGIAVPDFDMQDDAVVTSDVGHMSVIRAAIDAVGAGNVTIAVLGAQGEIDSLMDKIDSVSYGDAESGLRVYKFAKDMGVDVMPLISSKYERGVDEYGKNEFKKVPQQFDNIDEFQDHVIHNLENVACMEDGAKVVVAVVPSAWVSLLQGNSYSDVENSNSLSALNSEEGENPFDGLYAGVTYTNSSLSEYSPIEGNPFSKAEEYAKESDNVVQLSSNGDDLEGIDKASIIAGVLVSSDKNIGEIIGNPDYDSAMRAFKVNDDIDLTPSVPKT